MVATLDSMATFSAVLEGLEAGTISSGLSSSSNSAVMDLERRVRAVVGARFGGGGAFFLAVSSGSRFLVTVTTLRMR